MHGLAVKAWQRVARQGAAGFGKAVTECYGSAWCGAVACGVSGRSGLVVVGLGTARQGKAVKHKRR